MSENQDARSSKADAELEREIRNSRQFTLEEAIARMAGPGALKGESPVTHKRQAELEIESTIRRHIVDSAGALQSALLRRVRESEVLLKNYDQPLTVLAIYCQEVLSSDYDLKELVREADIGCGRLLGERPHFEKEGSPPDPDDCYTVESVRRSLSDLIKQLAAGEE